MSQAADEPTRCANPMRVFLLGATGTIGRAVAHELVQRGHELTCLVRQRSGSHCDRKPEQVAALVPGVGLRFGDVTDPVSLVRDGFAGETFDVLVSCLASRTGAPDDAWAIDYRAHVDALAAARAAGVRHVVLLSAICVQKPKLAFQHAKLAFEAELQACGLSYAIVRPTAYFKSLSGQVERVRQGKPYLVFGDGMLTSCKPISDRDLAAYMADCVEMQANDRVNAILPIGGPGPAITPREQGEYLFRLFDRPAQFRRLPVRLLDGIAATLHGASWMAPGLGAKAELARIGRYYATESMLVLDPQSERYDADATPSTGSDTLWDHYDRLARSEVSDDRGAHAVF